MKTWKFLRNVVFNAVALKFIELLAEKYDSMFEKLEQTETKCIKVIA